MLLISPCRVRTFSTCVAVQVPCSRILLPFRQDARSSVTKMAPSSRFGLRPYRRTFSRSQAGTRFSFLLIAVLASVAALLAAVGIYGVLSTNVRQRTAEIGVRLAFGASPSSVFGLIVRQGLILSAAGIAIGLAAALGLAQTMTSMLVGVRARDPLTFTGVTVLFLLVAIIVSVLAARHAAMVDPATALRGQ